MTLLGPWAYRMSKFIDDGYPKDLALETADRRRVGKVQLEAAEAMEALDGWYGENFRKGFTHTRSDVIDELLDTAFAALCAVEHLVDEPGISVQLLEEKAKAVLRRAGLGVETYPDHFGAPKVIEPDAD